MGMRPVFLGLLLLATAAPALAQEKREFCTERPGLGEPPCTLEPGSFAVDLGLVDWTLERDSETRTDTILAGDLLLRMGVADHAEIQFGWTPYGHVRMRDRASGQVSRVARAGDVTLSLRRNLMHPDGQGTSVALMSFASLPVGRMPVGAGDWGAGLIVPMSFDLADGLSLGLSPEIDAAADEDGDGRHLAYGSVIGLNADLSETVFATLELSARRDEDPAGHESEWLGGLSMGWLANDDLQFHIGTNVGLDRASPDVELYAGISRRF